MAQDEVQYARRHVKVEAMMLVEVGVMSRGIHHGRDQSARPKVSVRGSSSLSVNGPLTGFV